MTTTTMIMMMTNMIKMMTDQSCHHDEKEGCAGPDESVSFKDDCFIVVDDADVVEIAVWRMQARCMQFACD